MKNEFEGSIDATDFIENLQKELDVRVKYVATGEGHVYDWLQ